MLVFLGRGFDSGLIYQERRIYCISLNKCALPEFSEFSWDAGGAVSEMGGNEVVRYMDLTKLEFLFYLLPYCDVLVSMPTRPIVTVHFIVSSFVYVLCV